MPPPTGCVFGDFALGRTLSSLSENGHILQLFAILKMRPLFGAVLLGAASILTNILGLAE